MLLEIIFLMDLFDVILPKKIFLIGKKTQYEKKFCKTQIKLRIKMDFTPIISLCILIGFATIRA